MRDCQISFTAKFDVSDVECHHLCHVTKYVTVQSLAHVTNVKFNLKEDYSEQ